MQNSIFTLEQLSKSEDSLHYQAIVNVAHPIFKGHFPQQPILPGVCTMDLIKRCLTDALVRPLRYSYIKECKFLATIVPLQHTTLQVKITLKEDSSTTLSISAQVFSEETIMMKIKATLL